MSLIIFNKFFLDTLKVKFSSLPLHPNKKGRGERHPLLKADVAKLVDALDLGSSAARHGGSTPSIRTET